MRHDRIIGKAHGHPLRVVEIAPDAGPARGHIYISTGIHGDEPAGVVAIKWLLSLPRLPRWMRPFRWTIMPCINPAGIAAGTRQNPDGLDLNRQFRRDDLPEIAAVKRATRGKRFDLSLHLHEDYDGTGFYLYELSPRGVWLGERVIAAVKKIIPLEKRRVIERRAAHGGIVRPNPRILRRKLWPEALWQLRHHTDHTMTTETPSDWPLGRRVRAQLKALEVAARWLAEQ